MATDSINQTLFYSLPGADEIYRSKWFAFTAFAFLKDKNKCKKTLDSSQSRNVSQQEDSDVSLFSLSLVLVWRDQLHSPCARENRVQFPAATKFVSATGF